MGPLIRCAISLHSLGVGFLKGKATKLLLPEVTAYAREGELIAVIGRNGIGKSTLLRTIAGLQAPLSGEIKIDEKNINEFNRRQLSEKVGYISTEIVKVSHLSVYDLVTQGRFPYTNWFGRLHMSDDKVIRESIERTGMKGFEGRLLSELSDGERQRAMIALVLAQDASLMILDEPTAFLDISSRFDIIHLIKELTRLRQKTVIFSTHDLSIAVRQADKIWLLDESGVSEGAPEDLMLKGTFNTLFDNSAVQFNPYDGSFNIHFEQKGVVSLKGAGLERHWTEKALIRAGYSIDDSFTGMEVEVPQENEDRWKLRTNSGLSEYRSVYDLISALSSG